MFGRPVLLTKASLAAVLLLGVSAGATTNLHVHPEVAVNVDLHALCESLARECSDLEPEDFGMRPVNDAVPPLQGELVDEGWEAGENLGLKLLGERLHLHVHAEASVQANNTDDEDGSDAQQVPCADAPDCPDLISDAALLHDSVRTDVRTFAETDCAVVEGATQPGQRRLLRFSFGSPNLGRGDLEVGDPDDHPEWFEMAACHNHWHFREYADYRLWDVEGYAAWQAIRATHPGVPSGELMDAFPEVRDHFLSGHKQGFCVVDTYTYFTNIPQQKQFTNCNANQGISRLWGDEYHLFLDGQWVDVTGLAPGRYVLEVEVNPERLYAEEDYGNNAAALVVEI